MSTPKTKKNPQKTSKNNSKRRLGRGLSSLIRTVETPQAAPGESNGDPAAAVRQIPIDQIAANPHQPRRKFDPRELDELTQSIESEGVLQPILLSEGIENTEGKPFVLIAGERRLRASKQAGLTEIPGIVRAASRRQMIEWALIENIQRADLNPIERAEAYREYMDRFKLSQAQTAERLGQARPTVANYLRLLDLCDEVRTLIMDGKLSFGHAKVLAGLGGTPRRQLRLARRIVGEGMSVRKLETMAAEDESSGAKGKDSKTPDKPAYIVDLEKRMTETLGNRVTIHPSRKKNSGRVVLDYSNLDDFDRIAQALGVWEDSETTG